MDTIGQDLRAALRAVGHAPGFAIACILCIALGIAANVFVWSPYNAIVLRPLPYQDSGRILQLNSWRTSEQRRSSAPFSVLDYEDIARAGQERPGVFSDVSAWTYRQLNVGGLDEPERLDGIRATASLFQVLALRPALGRFFTTGEEHDGKVVVLSYSLWERKFGADPNVVGRVLQVNGEPYTAIGVMEKDVRFPDTEDLWLPLEPGDMRDHRDWRYLQVTARLAPGASVEQANAWLAEVMREIAIRSPATNRGYTAWTQPLQEEVAGEVRGIFRIMLGAVAFVLLIACANVANLLLVRGSARQREIAVRLAMGAPRHRIIRQLLTESLVLAAAGGALGAFMGAWAIDIFTATNAPSTMPFWMTFDVDRSVLGITALLTLLTGLLFGIVPALRLSAASVGEGLKQAGGRVQSSSSKTSRLRSSLVVVQLALSLVLLIGASLMIRSFMATQQANLGFRTQQLLTMDLSFAGPRYASDSAFEAALASLERDLEAIPGVTAAGFTSDMPVKRCCTTSPYFPEGKEYPESNGPVSFLYAATPGFFDAMGLTLLQGRALNNADNATATRVALVDEVFARREWPEGRAVGQRFKGSPTDSTWTTVVGVVRHVVARKVSQDRQIAEVFLPLAQVPYRTLTGVLHTRGDPSAIVPELRATVRRLDVDLPLARIEPMTGTIRDRMFEARVYSIMFTSFGVAALVLAGIGLYGVVSFSVAQRAHEMGIRLALGARPREILTLVLGGSARIIVVALAAGVPAALGLARLLRGTLYGVQTTDVATFVAIPTFLAGVALLASFVPAARASRVEPAVALRDE